MEDDEGDTTVGGEEPVIDKTIAGKQDGVALLHSDSNADNSNSPTPLVEENNRTKLECDDNRKSCGKIETSRTPSDSQNDSGTFISDSDVPNSPKKVNGEVELSKCDCAEQKSDANDNSGNVVKNSRLVEAETINSEPENTRVLRKRKRQTSPSSDEIRDTDNGQNLESNVEFKGFKKRYLAQSAIATNNTSLSSDPPPKPGSKCKKSSVKKTVPETQQHVLVSHQTLPDGTQSSAQLTEYVQYLGLQPTVKFKCYICGESGFPSILQLQKHQKVCLKTSNKKQTLVKPAPQTPTIEPSPSTNFRITRKVYLCSACGTYYENWNLFLHMREVHKRHICLFCLGMFSQADKLATHLSGKHAVVEGVYSSTDNFLSEFKGSYFLMCCTCERIFTERENFFDHSCSEGLVINADKACSLCGLRGAHFPTCRRAFTDSSASPPPPSSSVPATVENTSEPTQNSQLIQEPPQLSLSVTKYLIPVEKVADKKTNQKSNEMLDSTEEPQEKSRELSDIDDDYDISNAASFCHVNIHESQEKQKQAVTSKTKTYKGKREAVATEKSANELDPADMSSPSTNTDQNNVDSSDTIDNTKDENVQDKNVDLDHKTGNEKEPEESEEKVDKQEKADEQEKTEEEEKTDEQENIDTQEGDTVTEPASVEESAQKEDVEVEANKLEEEDKTELQNDEKHESRVTEETESNVENDAKQTTEEEKDSEPFLQTQTETDTQLSPKSEVSPKVSQQMDAKVSSKTPSATEADSESESSESGEESDETSSSSEASSEESDHHEEAEEAKEKERIDGSDIENADSDKMSLVVDENRSEEDEEVESQKEKTDDIEKQISDGKVSETEETKQDEEPKSDSESLPNVVEESEENKAMEDEKVEEPTESVQLAGDDVPLLELTLEENLDTMSIQMLLKESVKVSCLNCVYCNHAKKIAVNGKQLALHLLAEHRFAPVVCSDSGELTEVDGFVDRLKALLPELQQMFFNTDSYDNMDQTCMHPYDRTYECFHCHFVTTLHKELYVHNRKMHQKTILLCIMCKSNFYSYSELLCHLCPGIYVPESNISFRCCLCSVDGLPSAFRLMVHLRKRHHACDVCLETTGDQQKLSNHVWKHKLHHLCYRCGIAYRNKPDITKHLFWKHGTESVLCKKCLQKKWPHVYHFCIPPNAFVCEECNSSFSRAVALKVHKRLHAGDLPYSCSECEERFISRKLLTKHEEKHREPPPVESMETKSQENGPIDEIESQDKFQEGSTKIETESHEEADVLTHEDAASNGNSVKEEESQTKTKDSLSEADIADTPAEPSVAESLDELARHEDRDTSEKKSKVVDVYDLPPLNLSSESDDSDDDDERKETQLNVKDKSPAIESPAVNEGAEVCDREKIPESMPQLDDDVQQPIEVVDGIWDNFKTYKANLERRENQHIEIGESSTQKSETESCDKLFTEVLSVINMDHDYCGPPAGTSQSDEAIDHSEDMLTAETGTVQQVLAPVQDAGKTEEPKESTEDEIKACDADHNYCYTNTTSLNVEDEKEKDVPAATVETTSPNKKKQKSPKKKQKRSASSSSSDSSSNSDSSTCSCGTNCSCSSSSSSSSGSSSSQSSDSDSSSSEGRRRQAARRERRRERAKKRKVEETEDTPAQTETTEVAENGPSVQEEVPPPLPSVAEPEEVDVPIRESDLDTDETETDEDFYDKYPQRLANKLLAEKRNQLLMLAAVAPVNNGTMSQSGQSPPPSVIEEPVPKKKVKTKKHKKSQHQHSSSENKTENKLKLNIPSDYYSTQAPIFSKSTMPTTSASNSMNTTVLTTSSQAVPSPFLASQPEPSTPSTAYHSTGSGSETDSKRLSKRKRVPKRFYGDSSDEEPDQPPVKWRKVLPAASNSPVTTPQQTPAYTYKSTPVPVPEPVRVPTVPIPAPEEKSEEEAADDSDSDRDDVKKSSSESSNSESEADKEQDDDDVSDADSEVETPLAVQTSTVSAMREGEGMQQRNENLYCYCQCPYDEVSEMIACDGKDCTIEWFHFECVGIMVPPKGKWFCPDCRKRAAARSEYLVHVG